MMYLALKRAAASDARWYERAFAALTRWRLCSPYSHSAIAIDRRIYHANARHGLFESGYSPARWDLYPVPQGDTQRVLALFEQHRGDGYNWRGVLAFIVPWVGTSKRKFYCFEWCALALDPATHKAQRHTPETLLALLVNASGTAALKN